MATFGERLRLLREERKMAQKEIAGLLGLTYSAVGKYESDSRQPTPEAIHKLADYFHVSTDFLLGRSDLRQTAEEIAAEYHEMVVDLPGAARQEVKEFVRYIREKYKK